VTEKRANLSPLEAIDRSLADWDERLRRVDDNLLALESDSVYQVLSQKKSTLEGVTKARVGPALDALAQLFEQRAQLSDMIARARAVRESISTIKFWDNDDKLREIRALLEDASIHVGTTTTPLSKRSLLDSGPTDVAATPDDLLKAMGNAFTLARDAVAQVSAAWSKLEPRAEDAERAVTDAKKRAASFGRANEVDLELAAITRELTDLRASVAKDPLGATQTFEGAVFPRVQALAHRFDAMEAARDRAHAANARATKMRAELERAYQAARRELDTATVKYVVAKRALPSLVARELVDGLDAWSAKLKDTMAANRWSAAEIGLTRWIEAAGGYLASTEEVCRATHALDEKKAELAGRLSARRAQAKSLATRGASIDPALDDRARDVESLLAKTPLALADAELAVDAYESVVVALATRLRGQH
jgi:hypothetical protein